MGVMPSDRLSAKIQLSLLLLAALSLSAEAPRVAPASPQKADVAVLHVKISIQGKGNTFNGGCTAHGFSLKWEGDLEPADDDPAGLLPAQSFEFHDTFYGVADWQDFTCKDINGDIAQRTHYEVDRKATVVVILSLVRPAEEGQSFDRTPRLQLLFFTDLPAYPDDYSYVNALSSFFGDVTWEPDSLSPPLALSADDFKDGFQKSFGIKPDLDGRAGGEDVSADDPGWDYRYSGRIELSYGSVEAVIQKPAGYEKWRPVAGEDEKTAGGAMTVKVKLQKPGKPGVRPSRKCRIKFELAGVSREKGVSLNWPYGRPGTDDYDLRIEQDQNPDLRVLDKDGQTAETKAEVTEATVNVSSFDWGAWGTLTATATCGSTATAVAHIEGDLSKRELLIPHDEDGNHIADAWDENEGASGPRAADADADDTPLSACAGDGLTRYEEYRGFMVENVHRRLDPGKKDLFVYDDSFGEYEKGIDLFGELTDVEIHKIYGSEHRSKDRVVNFNRGNASLVEQTSIQLNVGGACTADQLRTGDTRRCLEPHQEGFSTGLGPPRYGGWIMLKMPANENAVAHEIGHAVGMTHHGIGDYYCDATDTTFNGGISIPDKKRRCRADPAVITWARANGVGLDDVDVAVQQGETSGDQHCLMRHPPSAFIEASDGSYEEGPPWEPRVSFCTTTKGTKLGDARPGGGNCRGQICISDVNPRRKAPWYY